MAQVRLIVGNLRDTVSAKASKGRKNPCTQLCEYIPFLVCPCSLYGLAELLSGNIIMYVLSLFSIMGVCGYLYSRFFGWNSTVMDIMIGIAFIGPLWVTCTIAPKIQFSGVKGELMTDVDNLHRTNRKIGKKIEKHRKNLIILKTATKKMTKGRRLQRTTVKKSDGISKRLKIEDEIIKSHAVTFHENVKNLETWGRTLPKRIDDFEKRVDIWLTDHMMLEFANEDFKDNQKVTKRLAKKLTNFPRHLETNCVQPMRKFQNDQSFVARCSKDLPNLALQMQEAWNQFADLVKSQEKWFCQNLVYTIRTNGKLTNFGQQEYNLFFDRLPSYLAAVVVSDELTFKKYASHRVGFYRFISTGGMRRLIKDIVDGVSKIDQFSTESPEHDTLRDIREYFQSRRSDDSLRSGDIANVRI